MFGEIIGSPRPSSNPQQQSQTMLTVPIMKQIGLVMMDNTCSE